MPSSLWSLLADAVILVHLLFTVFVVLGALLVARWAWVAWLHVPATAWGALVELRGLPCPLTPLENEFRVRAGEAGYAGGFIETYLLPLLYPGALTREIQVGLGVAVVAVNAALYLWIWRRSLDRSDCSALS